jgi:hypothetical protein
MQVRFFQGPDIAELETAINAWLTKHPRCEIIEVCQTGVPVVGSAPDLIVSVWYIED